MRLYALVSLLAMLSPPSLCERRNVAVCSTDPGFECGDGQLCDIKADGVGECVQAECTSSHNECPAEKPVCGSGRCQVCSGDADCKALSEGKPLSEQKQLCEAGRCVGCKTNDNCSGATAVCDNTSKVCRECSLHTECGMNGVCAKDDTFANLSGASDVEAIPKGSCVAAKHINLVSGNASALNSAINSASPAKPYIRIVNLSTNTKVSVGSLPAGLPAIYIIGPMADLAPSELTSQPPAILVTGSGQAMGISAGVHTTIEGLVFNTSGTGLDCTGGGMQTKVKIVRSLFTANGTALKSTAGCEISVDSSWFGPLLGLGANTLAMDLDSSQLDIVNSVFYRNGVNNMLGGIRIANTVGANPPRSVRIVNSSFVEQVFSVPADKVLAIDCKAPMSGTTLILNTLFINSTVPASGYTYVHANCRSASNIVGVASNDDGLSGPNSIADQNLKDEILTDAANGNLRYGQLAMSNVTTGGVASSGGVAAPSVDMERKIRKDTISIGAFQK